MDPGHDAEGMRRSGNAQLLKNRRTSLWQMLARIHEHRLPCATPAHCDIIESFFDQLRANPDGGNDFMAWYLPFKGTTAKVLAHKGLAHTHAQAYAWVCHCQELAARIFYAPCSRLILCSENSQIYTLSGLPS